MHSTCSDERLTLALTRAGKRRVSDAAASGAAQVRPRVSPYHADISIGRP